MQQIPITPRDERLNQLLDKWPEKQRYEVRERWGMMDDLVKAVNATQMHYLLWEGWTKKEIAEKLPFPI